MTRPSRFQEKTIAYIIKRFWSDPKPARRFLVADEVGLGKTVVAREIIAETLRRRRGKSADIVYLCSSQPVASQNLRRLKVHGHGVIARATRLTLLATEPPAKDGVRYFALTPDTSFKVTGRSGLMRERALIYRCLRTIFRSPGFRAIMQQVSETSWQGSLDELDRRRPDPTITAAFKKAVARDEALKTDIRALAARSSHVKSGTKDHKAYKKQRDAIVGRLRKELALRSAESLAKTGLVIVDEFQRFSQLFDLTRAEEDFGVRLAERLLTDQIAGRRVLLLSATPYRTLGSEPVDGTKPYSDFIALVRFLADSERATILADHLDRYARALQSKPFDPVAIAAARDGAQTILRAIMCRTERTRATADANSMVIEDIRPLTSETMDLEGAFAARRIAARLKVRDPLEFWKSAPYFLDFMKGYEFRDSAEKATEKDRRFVANQARDGRLLLDRSAVRRLESLVTPSQRLRDLIEDILPVGSERLLWLPPSLAYLQPKGIFASTPPGLKRLVFTEWRLAPDAISALVSYETERRLAADLRASRTGRIRKPERSPGLRHKRFRESGAMLRLGRTGSTANDPTLSMIPLSLLLSGPVMAAMGDPLPLAAASGAALSAAQVLQSVQAKIKTALAQMPQGQSGGGVDERWYWAAPLLLEGMASVAEWLLLDDAFLTSREVASTDLDRVRAAIDFILQHPRQLGRRPKNLAAVLAKIAVAGPGVCAYRALGRTWQGKVSDGELRRAAFHVGRGFQSLFNQSEASAAVQLEYPGRKRIFWDQVLDYCIDGNLQALLDEQFHLEADALAMFDGGNAEKLEKAAVSVHASLTLRRASVDIKGLEPNRADPTTTKSGSLRMRCRHAIRFAEIKDADGAVSRLDAVRAAFNSPFRPFVLASTAVGQEGLDFHPWCHAVVHWNLPRSPVDLEQREGRVHRYKGHAVRLNVARFAGLASLTGTCGAGDPWNTLFTTAAQHDQDNDLSPFWLFEHGTDPVKVRRIIPFPNLSREQEVWPRLRARLASYRLVIGLPRQEDLLDAIERNGITAEQVSMWRIDLTPP